VTLSELSIKLLEDVKSQNAQVVSSAKERDDHPQDIPRKSTQYPMELSRRVTSFQVSKSPWTISSVQPKDDSTPQEGRPTQPRCTQEGAFSSIMPPGMSILSTRLVSLHMKPSCPSTSSSPSWVIMELKSRTTSLTIPPVSGTARLPITSRSSGKPPSSQESVLTTTTGLQREQSRQLCQWPGQ